MSETLVFPFTLLASSPVISDWRAQLMDTDGVDIGTPISSNFVHIGGSRYSWTYDLFPDLFQGLVKMYSDADPTTILAFFAINPIEAVIDLASEIINNNNSVDMTSQIEQENLAPVVIDIEITETPPDTTVVVEPSISETVDGEVNLVALITNNDTPIVMDVEIVENTA